MSAYRGANSEAGRLADFLEAVKLGIVPQGSVLLVEALDRLSRLVPRKALKVLEGIIESGVDVVTLNDGRRYSLESIDADPINLLLAVMLFMRANEESATKARRLKAAWEGKRERASETPLTAVVPAWLRIEGTGPGRRIVPIPEHCATVQRVFDEYLAGLGLESIATKLNSEGVPCFGSAARWHRAYINKIVDNPAAKGVYVPHRYEFTGSKRVRVPLDPLPGYYPAAVSDETFQRAKELRDGGGRQKARAGQPVSLLGGLARCPLCESTMTRYSKGSGVKGGKPKLICTKAKAGAFCVRHPVTLADVEDALLSGSRQWLADCPSGDEGLDDTLRGVLAGIDGLEDAIGNVLDALAKGPSAALSARLHDYEQALATEQQRRDDLLNMLATASGPRLAKRLEELEAALTADPMDRAQANAAMRALLSGVVVDYTAGLLQFNWKHGGQSEARFAWPMEVH